MAKRVEIKKETKIVNGQKEKIAIERLLPNFQEKKEEEDFELIPVPLFKTLVIDNQGKSLTVASSDLSSIWKIGIKPLLKFETKTMKPPRCLQRGIRIKKDSVVELVYII